MQPQRRLERGPLRSSLVAHGSWLPAGALLSAHLAFSAYGDRSLLPAIGLALTTVGVFFLSVLLHGGAHLLAARLLGHRAVARIYVFGDVLEIGTVSTRPVGLLIAFAGPAASALIGAALFFASSAVGGDASDVMRTTAFANLAVAAFNLLPGLPMDGGRAVAVLTGTWSIASRGGRLMAVAGFITGVWLMLNGPSALDDTALGLWLALAGAFVLGNPGRRTRLPRPPVRLRDETAGQWARPFAGRVDASEPVPAQGGPYAVSDDGRLAGVLTVDARPGDITGEAMVPWSPALGIRQDAPLIEALERLADEVSPVVVVVDDGGVVRGVLDETTVRSKLAEI